MTGASWERVGELRVADGRLVFPEASKRKVPGLYRFLGSDNYAYVGQAAVSLRSRFRRYRSNSGLPAVNLNRLTTRRNAHHLREAVESGGTVTVELITGPSLADNSARDALERAEIRKLASMTGVKVLNRSHTAGDAPVPLPDGRGHLQKRKPVHGMPSESRPRGWTSARWLMLSSEPPSR